MLMKYHRAQGNTTEAAAKAIELLRSPDYKQAVFSTSPWEDDGTATHDDGPHTNWPYLVAAIHVGDAVHVFDSVLLNAARMPRDREVRDILDAALAAGRAFYTADGKAFFTASKTPEEVVRLLVGNGRPLFSLDASTRRDFFVNLARGMTEAEFDRLRQTP